jgi:hypothetical protein
MILTKFKAYFNLIDKQTHSVKVMLDMVENLKPDLHLRYIRKVFELAGQNVELTADGSKDNISLGAKVDLYNKSLEDGNSYNLSFNVESNTVNGALQKPKVINLVGSIKINNITLSMAL